METVSSLLALYDGNSPVTGELVYVLCARQSTIELSRFYISYLGPVLWKKNDRQYEHRNICGHIYNFSEKVY